MITRFCLIATILFMLVNSFHEKTQFRSMRMINLLQTTYLNPGIVSAESSLCATIHWGSSCVCLICADWLLPPVKILWVEVTIQPVMAGRICNSIMLLALINLMHCETSIHQDQIPATTAQTTRDDRACTAEARIRTKFPTRRPKWPESRACVPQKGASGPDSSPDSQSNQKRERVHRRSAHQGQIAQI